MMTAALTYVIDFNTEVNQRVIGANSNRIWLSFMAEDAVILYVNPTQMDSFGSGGFITQFQQPLIMTKGDYGSLICGEWYMFAQFPFASPAYVTEVFLI